MAAGGRRLQIVSHIQQPSDFSGRGRHYRECPFDVAPTPLTATAKLSSATALHDPKDPHDEAVAAFYVQASGGLGTLCAPVLSLTTDDTERGLGYSPTSTVCGSSRSSRSTPRLR
ncbi:hypothetical protein ACF05T_28465 [Streptomyces lateritius]|uniref:Uncharacterized protein n=1 Tax=Streptomyces lateritius TaxID=67313 RepID=A0ABW6YJR9_9ACTN